MAMKEDLSSGALYGYARVSSKDQSLARQLDALAAFGVEPRCVFADKASGKDFERAGYRRLLRRLAAGDVVVVASIDRLGRNYEEILEQWRVITKEKRADVVVLDMPLLDTRQGSGDVTGVFLADIVLQLLSYVAQIEREKIKQRQAEGIAAAKARGVRFGRPSILRPASYDEVRQAYARGEITRAQAASQLGVCVKTFDRWMKKDRQVAVDLASDPSPAPDFASGPDLGSDPALALSPALGPSSDPANRKVSHVS